MDDMEMRVIILERQLGHISDKIDKICIMVNDTKSFSAGLSFFFALLGSLTTMILDELLRH